MVCYEMSSHLIKKGTFCNNTFCAENLSQKEMVYFCTNLVQKFANGAKIRQNLTWKKKSLSLLSRFRLTGRHYNRIKIYPQNFPLGDLA